MNQTEGLFKTRFLLNGRLSFQHSKTQSTMNFDVASTSWQFNSAQGKLLGTIKCDQNCFLPTEPIGTVIIVDLVRLPFLLASGKYIRWICFRLGIARFTRLMQYHRPTSTPFWRRRLVDYAQYRPKWNSWHAEWDKWAARWKLYIEETDQGAGVATGSQDEQSVVLSNLYGRGSGNGGWMTLVIIADLYERAVYVM